MKTKSKEMDRNCTEKQNKSIKINMSVYEQQLAQMDMYAKIMEGKVQADKGQLLDGTQTMAKLKAKYLN